MKSRIIITAAFLLAASFLAKAQHFTRDLNVDLLINHAGYVPEASKTVAVKGLTNSAFEVINTSSGQVVKSGTETTVKCLI